MWPSSLQSFHQWQDLLLEYLYRDRADALVANDPIAIDHIRFRYAIDPVVDADSPVAILHGQRIRVAVLVQPQQRVFALVLVVESIDRQHVALREVDQDRMRSEERRVRKECRSRWSPYH